MTGTRPAEPTPRDTIQGRASQSPRDGLAAATSAAPIGMGGRSSTLALAIAGRRHPQCDRG
jgi:hypothetical protein